MNPLSWTRSPSIVAWAVLVLACFESAQILALTALTTTAGSTPNIPASLKEGVPGIAINSHDVTIHVSLAPHEEGHRFFIGYSINGGDEIRYTGPGHSPFTSEQPLFISGLPDGLYTIAITAVDEKQHSSPVTLTYSFAVDTTPPVTTLLRVPPALSNQAAFTFKFNSSKNSSEYGRLSFFCSSNGGKSFSGCGTCRKGLVPCTGEHTLDLGHIPDGVHRFVVYSVYTFTAMDPLVTLKEQDPPAYSFTIDATPPVISVLQTPKLRSNSTRAKFVWECQDPQGTSAQCKIDGYSLTNPTKRTWSSCQSPLILQVSPKTHAFQIFCVDGVGNPTPTVLYTWLVHQQPPLSHFNTDKLVVTMPHSTKHPNHQQPQGMFGYTTTIKEVNGLNATAVESTNAQNVTIHFQCGHPQSFPSFQSTM